MVSKLMDCDKLAGCLPIPFSLSGHLLSYDVSAFLTLNLEPFKCIADNQMLVEMTVNCVLIVLAFVHYPGDILSGSRFYTSPGFSTFLGATGSGDRQVLMVH